MHSPTPQVPAPTPPEAPAAARSSSPPASVSSGAAPSAEASDAAVREGRESAPETRENASAHGECPGVSRFANSVQQPPPLLRRNYIGIEKVYGSRFFCWMSVILTRRMLSCTRLAPAQAKDEKADDKPQAAVEKKAGGIKHVQSGDTTTRTSAEGPAPSCASVTQYCLPVESAVECTERGMLPVGTKRRRSVKVMTYFGTCNVAKNQANQWLPFHRSDHRSAKPIK